MNTYRNLVKTLTAANKSFRAHYIGGCIYIETDTISEMDSIVKLLGFNSYSGYIDGVEVIIG